MPGVWRELRFGETMRLRPSDGCLMTTTQRPRKWYHRDDVVDEYKQSIRDDEETLPMIKLAKVLKATIVNLAVAGLALYAISRGGDPTILGALGLAVLAAYNGLELGDYLALLQAAREIQTESKTDD